MDDLTLVRNKIGDSYNTFTDEFIGDGEQVSFRLSKKRVRSTNFFYSDSEVNETFELGSLDFPTSTINFDLGIITFSAPVVSGMVFQVIYQFSAFSDSEIQGYIDTFGSAKGTIGLLDTLLADAARSFDYASGIESMKPSQVFDNLRKLREMLSKDLSSSLSSSASISIVDRTNDYYP